jgi:hypothetical protein
MRTSSLLPLLGAAAATVFFTGCRLTVTVTDFGKTATVVRNAHLCGANALEVIDGDATRYVKLQSVRRIKVYPQSMRNVGGHLYYQTQINMSKDSAIGYADHETGKKPGAFLRIDGTLCGDAGGGAYEINLDKVSEIEVSEKKR